MQRATTVTTLGAGLAVIVAGVACGGNRPGVGSADPNPVDSVTLSVVNQNFYDANIVMHYEGLVSQRLGLVNGNTTQTFRIPWHPMQLRMEMRLVGVGRTFSDILTVDPGDELELLLLPNLHRRVVRR